MSKTIVLIAFCMLCSTLLFGQSKTTTPQPPVKDIHRLLQEGKIEIQFMGKGLEFVSVNLHKLVPYPIKVKIPLGTLLGYANPHSQNSVTIESKIVQLADNNWKTVEISSANTYWIPSQAPGGKDSLVIELSAHQEELRKLMVAVNKSEVDFAVRQAAVWIIMDNADYSELDRLVSSYNFYVDKGKRVIAGTETAQAIKLCSDVGIDIVLKDIWSSRDFIYKQLENGVLKKWMGMMIDKTKANEHVLSLRLQSSIEWVNIPAGTFLMGSPTNELNRRPDEEQHEVTVNAFKMSKYEVTFELFNAYCSAIGQPYCGSRVPSDLAKHPVTLISWNEATAFAEWMGCRLPTEAEWEYACRAGTTTPFNTGNNLDTTQANYNKKYILDSDHNKETMPVGSFPPNAWGLFDMHGNIGEWCSDFWSDYPATPQTNPTGPSAGYSKIFRGGSFFYKAADCRSARREHIEPLTTSSGIGIRLVSLK